MNIIKKNIVKIFVFLTFFFAHLIVLSQDEQSFFVTFFKKGDLVFDIGANTGKKADIFLSIGAYVICIEPQPQCIRILHEKYDQQQNVIIVEKGIASTAGMQQMMVCSQADTISTFSKEWTEKGRFFDSGYIWDKTIEVEAITLDRLIEMYGIPQFCKIDVENFEYEVLKGLSHPIPYISFEFAIEYFEHSKACLEHLQKLGYKHFNFTLGETPELALDAWQNADVIIKELENLTQSTPDLWGDIYARYEN